VRRYGGSSRKRRRYRIQRMGSLEDLSSRKTNCVRLGIADQLPPQGQVAQNALHANDPYACPLCRHRRARRQTPLNDNAGRLVAERQDIPADSISAADASIDVAPQDDHADRQGRRKHKANGTPKPGPKGRGNDDRNRRKTGPVTKDQWLNCLPEDGLNDKEKRSGPKDHRPPGPHGSR
jgi:hypothetical protein